MSEVISSVELSGTKYAALYVSDPFESIHYPAYRELERFLAEGTAGNEGNDSAHSTDCDEVCKIKSSLLEGVFVVSHCPCLQHFCLTSDLTMMLFLFLYGFIIIIFPPLSRKGKPIIFLK